MNFLQELSYNFCFSKFQNESFNKNKFTLKFKLAARIWILTNNYKKTKIALWD